MAGLANATTTIAAKNVLSCVHFVPKADRPENISDLSQDDQEDDCMCVLSLNWRSCDPKLPVSVYGADSGCS